MATRTREDPAPSFLSTLDAPPETSHLSPSDELLRVNDPLEAMPAAALVGQRIGHFRVRSPLGRGGMGVIYRAEDEALRREVALKVLPPSTTANAERRRRLLREARAAAAVNHPNIATVYEVGEADGRIYIAMELVQGKSLGQLLAAGRLNVDEAVSVARQILHGLQKAHDAGLVHRDLKPDNVMITPEGVVKVLDFGLAKQRAHAAEEEVDDPPETSVTAEGRILGTPLYMSPEQARGVAIDHRSDLFSFGVVLYEMLTDRRPFAGETMADVLTAILRDKPEPPDLLNPDVPPSLARIVERCLAKEPAARYPDGRSLVSDLDRIFPTTGEGGHPAASASKGTPVMASDARVAPPKRRFARWTAGLGVVVVGLAVGLAAVRPWKASDPPPVSPSALPAPRPTALTDLPLPTSKSPEAIAAYTEALQAQRAGNWGLAATKLRRAVALDPLMIQAHLRLSIVPEPRRPSAANRASYAIAAQARGSLSERDQRLLHAMEPIIDRDPPDQKLAALRMREATERYPFDAELFVMLAYLEQSSDREAGLRAAKRGSELDPLYADAWQSMGGNLAAMGRTEESLQALNRCIQISPATSDCQSQRAGELGMEGRCAEMEESLRHATSSSPQSHPDIYGLWANALHALGRPPETVLGVLERKWTQISSDERRRPIELLDRAALHMDAGRFTDAETLLQEGNALCRSDPEAEIHAWYAKAFAYLYRETGRPREAAKVADDYLKRKDLWIGEGRVRGVTMLMLRTMLHTGALSKEAFATARAAWLARKIGDEDDAGLRWLFGHGIGVEQREEAEEALAALAALPPDAFTRKRKRNVGAALGELYLLTGRIDEALAYLRPEQPVCYGIGEGPPALSIGLALEQKGDKDGACNAYAAVLDRWGNAKPRSVTADKAKAHAKTLGCPERKLAAAPRVPSGLPD